MTAPTVASALSVSSSVDMSSETGTSADLPDAIQITTSRSVKIPTGFSSSQIKALPTFCILIRRSTSPTVASGATNSGWEG